MQLDEAQFVAQYMELNGCSEAAARSVYMLFPAANLQVPEADGTEAQTGSAGSKPGSSVAPGLNQAA